MLAQILEIELLTELSEQQQQVVAGGLDGIAKTIKTFFDQDHLDFLNQAGSGPGGSFVNTGIKQEELHTGSFEKLKAKFS